MAAAAGLSYPGQAIWGACSITSASTGSRGSRAITSGSRGLEDVLDRDDTSMDESERARRQFHSTWRNGAGRPAHWMPRQPAPGTCGSLNC